MLLCSFLLLLGALAVSINQAVAQTDPPKIEESKTTPGELKLPDDLLGKDDKTGKPTKKLRATTCPSGCQKEYDALKAALEMWYAAQSVQGADKYNKSNGKDGDQQNKSGDSGLKNVLGEADKSAAAAKTNYKAQAKKDAKSVTPDKLLDDINKALAALKKCEAEKCPEPKKPKEEKKKTAAEKWVEEFNGFADFGFTPQDLQNIENWAKNIVFPKCGDQKKWKAKLDQLIKDIDTKIDAVAKAVGAEGGQKMKDAAVSAQDALKAAKTKIQDFRDKTLPTLNPCSDDGSMYFPGTPRDDQTYAVLFTDTGVVCTFGRSEPIGAPITPTDASFNPIPGDIVPTGGGAPIDTPKTPPGGPSGSPTLVSD
jgi:hypothetical protein